jgi:putative glutamine amidotransferase
VSVAICEPIAAPARMPLVGITGPRLQAAEIASTPPILLHAWADVHYAFYPQAVALAGGLPVHLPRDADPEALVARLDAVVVAGGQDVDPRRYGRQPTEHSTRLDPDRDEFELAIVRAALASDMPLVGVCRGAQLLNVACGGTLFDDLRAVQRIEHALVLYPPEIRVHEVRLTAGTIAHGVYGDALRVNSFHHQALDELGDGVVSSGIAPDGVIEAIEVAGARAIGVQWHPEMLAEVDPLFRWLVTAATAEEAPAMRLERSSP